jgi:hypothetical protein
MTDCLVRFISLLQQLPGNMKQMQIESVVSPSGNSGHVVVSKAWIGKEAIVKLKEKEIRGTEEVTSWNERLIGSHAEGKLNGSAKTRKGRKIHWT